MVGVRDKEKKIILLYLFNDISRTGSRIGTNEKPFQRVKIPRSFTR